MPRLFNPFQFVLITLAGWTNEHQQQIIEYLREENRVLREQLGGRRLRFNDVQRRRLAVKAKALGRRHLSEISTIITPETLLGWHRELIALPDRARGIGTNKASAWLVVSKKFIARGTWS